ncbi:serine hydrolase domain-containing protein [Chitinophaga nivalis]|uniref:Beta-lactamase family protein n=1 Tax=Chitinophaga nivalis TaxID=2991709 RepID=A0ABT3IJ23_9BACT|nr:serine hydrolase domain-containing protein [Chitinophaga nivalis]MCW3483921.1 beta-lactamase family protein [Chitinophaga nivalis]
MKGVNTGCFCIFILWLSGFTVQPVYSQARYKGAPKHAAPGADMLPDPHADYPVNSAVPGPLKDKLDKQVKQLFALTGMPGMSAAMLIAGKGLWRADTGFISLPLQQKVDTTTLFYWASVSKLITATIIAMLVQEQQLSYDSKLADWFPQFQHAKDITIDALLQHTSGLYSFNHDSTFHNSKRYYTPPELLELVTARNNLFRPGEYWAYSNTGYLLLAMIAEKIEKKTFAQIVQDRMATPFHLASLRVLMPQERPDNLAIGHVDGYTIMEDYSTPLGAGNIISNAKDMVLLLHALLTGQISSLPMTKERLHDLYPMFDKGMYYGRGMILSDFHEINQTKNYWIGHNGGTEDYRALVVYDVATKAFVAVAVNQQVPVEAIAGKLLEQLK